MVTVLIAAGGTGGHVFPGLVVAERMVEEGLNVHWVGSGTAVERILTKGKNMPIDTIAVRGLRDRSLLAWLGVPFMLLRACWQAWRVMVRVRPVGVLGMGGYVSGPIGFVAWLLRKPLLIHEQNAVLGWSNRLLLPFAFRLLTAFPDVHPCAKSVVLGNPVSKRLLDLPPPEVRLSERDGVLHLLVLGGSQGAAELNQIMPQILARTEHLEVWHQSGARDLAQVKDVYESHGVDATVSDFIDDMPRAYTWADLVVCRAGALTISELAAVGVASILVPLLGVAGNHQLENARIMTKCGAARVLSMTAIKRGVLNRMLEGARKRDSLVKMACAAYRLRVDNAAERVVEECKEVFGV